MPKSLSPDFKQLTRKEARDLEIEISFLEGIVRRDPQWVEALQVLGDDYYKKSDYPSWLGILKQLSIMFPGDPQLLYRMGCAFALLNQSDASIALLQESIRYGFNDFRSMLDNIDLASVHGHPFFIQIRARVRGLNIGTS